MLAREYPDHIRPKLSADTDRHRLGKHVYPIVGDVPLHAFTLDHAERVMKQLPSDPGAAGTRRQVAQAMCRILAMAVFPLRIIKESPIPRGFLPKPAPRKAQGYVYPDEDRTLLACAAVALCWRVFFGFLHREGMRSTEARRLLWAHLDLERGAIRLDKNKTRDARAWPLAPGVTEALRAWKTHRETALGRPLRPDEPVFVTQRGSAIRDNHLAALYREQLRVAGVKRPELFEQSAERRHIVLHATRSAFITINLASGMPEMKISDRTGHKDSSQIARYRRQARTVEELNLGDFAPMDQAIPELLGDGDPTRGSGRRNGRQEDEESENSPEGQTKKSNDSEWVRRKGLEPLQELPHWNLKTGDQAAKRSDSVGSRGPTPGGDPTDGNGAHAGGAHPDARPEARAFTALIAEAGRAAALGDDAAAVRLTEAAAALLSRSRASMPRDEDPAGVPVVDLAAHRRRR